MIRAALSAVVVVVVGGSTACHAGQLVELGGLLWEQPGNSAYYKAPGCCVAAEARTTPPGKTMQQYAPGWAGALHDASHLLRSAALDLDKDRKTGEDKRAEDAESKITRALELLRERQ